MPSRAPAAPDEPSPPEGPDLPGMVMLPGDWFWMGARDRAGFPGDGEGPVRRVRVDAFRIGATAVTNAQFATFVAREAGSITRPHPEPVARKRHRPRQARPFRRRRLIRRGRCSTGHIRSPVLFPCARSAAPWRAQRVPRPVWSGDAPERPSRGTRRGAHGTPAPPDMSEMHTVMARIRASSWSGAISTPYASGLLTHTRDTAATVRRP